jgi:hypothetical protein
MPRIHTKIVLLIVPEFTPALVPKLNGFSRAIIGLTRKFKGRFDTHAVSLSWTEDFGPRTIKYEFHALRSSFIHHFSNL